MSLMLKPYVFDADDYVSNYDFGNEINSRNINQAILPLDQALFRMYYLGDIIQIELWNRQTGQPELATLKYIPNRGEVNHPINWIHGTIYTDFDYDFPPYLFLDKYFRKARAKVYYKDSSVEKSSNYTIESTSKLYNQVMQDMQYILASSECERVNFVHIYNYLLSSEIQVKAALDYDQANLIVIEEPPVILSYDESKYLGIPNGNMVVYSDRRKVNFYDLDFMNPIQLLLDPCYELGIE